MEIRAEHGVCEQTVAKRERRMGNSSMQRIALFEPSPFDLQPRSDLIRIRGEAQRLHDSDVIEVEVPGFPVVQAHWQETRLNFQKSVLAVDSRYTRLFFLDFDASSLPDGRVPIQIRLRSEGEIIGKVESAVVVDHDRGFRSAYERWMEEFERPAEALMQLRLEAIESRPNIGILLLVSDADDEAHVGRAIHSIMQQSYPDWQLMVVPSSAARAGVLEAVRELTEHDNRIRIAEPRENSDQPWHYGGSTRQLQSEHVAVFRATDQLAASTLAHIATRLEEHPDADLLYADEDSIDESGQRQNPFFKPDWSPDLLLSFNYIGSFIVVRKGILEDIEPISFAPQAAAFYDLVLKTGERAKRIEHIPSVFFIQALLPQWQQAKLMLRISPQPMPFSSRIATA